MLRHYKGKLGEFDYDDTLFQLVKRDNAFGYNEYLECIYDGMSVNNIKIPDGINCCYAMFYRNRNLKYTPYIPDSVVDATEMFRACPNLIRVTNFPAHLKLAKYMLRGCSHLKTIPEFPATIENAEGMFYNCVDLNSIPEKLPKALLNAKYMFYKTAISKTPYMYDSVVNANDMYNGCHSLITVDSISDNIVDASFMFMNCDYLKTVNAPFPKALKYAKAMFDGCISLSIIPNKFPPVLEDCELMFANCSSLKKVPRILPKSVTNVRNMFLFCTSLQNYLVPYRKRPNLKYKDMYKRCSNIAEPSKIKGIHDNPKRTQLYWGSIDFSAATGLGITQNTAIDALETNRNLEDLFCKCFLSKQKK